MNPSRVFDSLRQTFEGALGQTTGLVERRYVIGERVVRLCFAGDALVTAVTGPLSHLATEILESPALTVYVWDGDSLPSAGPTLPDWWWDSCTWRGGVHVKNGAIYSAAHASTLSLLDAERNIGLYWVSDPERLTTSELGSPLLRIFHWWTLQKDVQLVHAAAVGWPERGAIFAGKGGSGKSTIGLTAIGAGLSYAADDYCLVSADRLYVHSLYSSGKVHVKDVERFPRLAPALADRGAEVSEKALYLFANTFASQVVHGFPLRAVVVPRVSGVRDTTFAPLAPAAALLALAPSTIFQLPGGGALTLKQLGRIVSRLPCYTLHVGTDLSQIPEAIGRLICDKTR